MKLSLQSQLSLYPLTIRKDKKHYIVEESFSGDFFEMPEICIKAIDLINKGELLESIESNLQALYPEEDIDILDFANQLLELGLIRKIDGEEVKNEKKNLAPDALMWISPKLGRFFFNRHISKLYILFFLSNILLISIHPELFPTYKDLFIFDAMMLNMLVYMAITLCLIVVHEFGHVLAIRAHNLPAKMSIGHRLFLVVFQTDLSLAWKLPPQQRNKLYLAGMAFDQTLLLIAFSLKLTMPSSSNIVIGIISMIIFDLFIKTIYQCCFYMKTDLYYVCENFTGCYNLLENGKHFLSNRLPFFKKDTTTTTYQEEKNVIRLYSLFYLSGILLTISLVILYFLPQAIYAYTKTIPELLHPMDNPYFWDALVFIGQSVIMLSLLIYSWSKKRSAE